MTKSELNALACDLREATLKRKYTEDQDLITKVWQVIDKMYEYYRDWPEQNKNSNDPLASNPNAPPFPKS